MSSKTRKDDEHTQSSAAQAAAGQTDTGVHAPGEQDEYNIEEYLNRELLRFTTAGSVDDGKSTLIGRLLFDSKAIFQDQMEQLEASSQLRGEEDVNLALLTDGLRAEREQGITIDVAYRYFSTPKRKFIIADTPGHEQYTRNMVTGASTADLAIVLIDARKGVLTQSKRHGFIASLLGIPHLVVAVNKMDLVDWSEEVFNNIVSDYTDFCDNLAIDDISFIPISALTGDNVVDKSSNMDWYEGRSVLHHLETVILAGDRNLEDFRFPVQYVVRPHLDFRGFAGRIASGTVKKGDAITALPSNKTSSVQSIVTYEGELEEAFESQSVILTLEDEIDISRGDMIVKSEDLPESSTTFEAVLCWMDDSNDLSLSNHYILQQTTRRVQAYVNRLEYNIDVNDLSHNPAESLTLNEIGAVRIETAHPLYFDAYSRNRQTGSFVLIDPATNLTVAAGMIRHSARQAAGDEPASRTPAERSTVSPNVKWEDTDVSLAAREERNGHKAQIFWFTGLSGSGKSTIAKALEKRLFAEGRQVVMLDGDNIRHGLNGDLGFSEADRQENIRRVGHAAKLFYDAGFIVLCTFISPRKAMRDEVRRLFPEGRFREVHVKVDLEEAKRRDPKGLYKKAEAGEINDFTGIHQPYEVNHDAEVFLDTQKVSVEQAVTILREMI
ncbi:sulfate adenylyltransferase subunit CysN [Salinispira pacifica]|uniref:Multifunctional fusion protein n=1 Tax=Salinispira pacifica TaxID=1307761 RepID=V5WL48_9SPIO|nr:sulfate adenylyltransferase subunit CysN [Salinispira pacifica]AHC16532.1 Sulfate adenylyltransferase subunit 1 [Salinispira pacifica]